MRQGRVARRSEHRGGVVAPMGGKTSVVNKDLGRRTGIGEDGVEGVVQLTGLLTSLALEGGGDARNVVTQGERAIVIPTAGRDVGRGEGKRTDA